MRSTITCIASLATITIGPALSPSPASAAPPCGSWEQVQTPNPGLFRNGFVDADANNGPLFGLLRSVDQDGSAAPVTYHLLRRESAGWTDLGEPVDDSVPNPPSYRALGVSPGGHVWLGGAVEWHPVITARPAMVRWDASSESWDDPEMIELMPQTVYPFTDRGGSVEAIDVAPDGTVFAVGFAVGFGNGLDASVPLFLINDGSGWVEIADPDFNWPGSLGGTTVLEDVLAFSSDNVWAVGRHAAGQGVGAGGLVVHWDGTSLELIEDPGNGGIFLSRDLGGIDGNAPDDFWVVGDGSVVDGPTATLAHFDGSDFTLVPSPYPGLEAIDHVAVADDGTAWASGVFADAEETFFDGSAWSLQPFAAADPVRVQRMVRDGNGVLWALGDVNFLDSFAQRLQCADDPCPADLDGSGAVDVADLITLLAAWGGPEGDIDGDGTTGVADLLEFLAAWGPCV